MNAGYISAFTGLLGVAIGGVTSFTTSYLTQNAQLREHNREIERAKREKLFSDFISEASRLYGDALSHEKDDIADFVQLYALVARMRLLASREVVTAAELAMAAIMETYLAPNRSLHELHIIAQKGEMNFLRGFADVCRAELARVNRP